MKYEQLNLVERSTLAAMRAAGHGVVEIARQMQRDRTTIYREVRRNRAERCGRRNTP